MRSSGERRLRSCDPLRRREISFLTRSGDCTESTGRGGMTHRREDGGREEEAREAEQSAGRAGRIGEGRGTRGRGGERNGQKAEARP